MTTDTITIPPEALYAAAKCCPYSQLFEVHAACLAMLKAWPRMKAARRGTVFTNTWQDPEKGEIADIIILPLPQENNNAEG